jgi:radical SAM protein with 4Fe4S-binding SPASM domain
LTTPISPDERERMMKRPRPLPILPSALDNSARKFLPLAEPREKDTKYRPLYAVWETTLRCDLTCRHCGSRAGLARHNELSTAECLDVVRQLAELGVREVATIGGEAYLREDWLDIIREIKKLGMMPTMTTGARSMTREMAAEAGQAGLRNVSVSIDGDEATHDRLRGVKGSYKAAVAALGYFRDGGVRIGVNSQINRLSMPHLSHVLDMMIDVKAVGWQIQLTAAMGRAADEPDVLVQPYDLLELFPLLSELEARARKHNIYVSAGNNIGYFGPYEDQLRGRSMKGHHASCGAGRGTIGIEADGTIKGCPSLTTMAWGGGNVRQHSIKEIWERAEPLRYTRDRTVRDLWGYCATCYYADECRAGCTWTAEVLFGRPGNNPLCHHRALEMDKAGKRERIVRVEAPPGKPCDHGLFEIVVEDKPDPR